MREQFESIPIISEKLKGEGVCFDDELNRYVDYSAYGENRDVDYLNGAWAIYKEHQKMIRDLTHYKNKLQLSDNLTMQCIGDDIEEILK